MNSLIPALNASFVGGRTARMRRIAASLLVGWFAFWLNSTLLACCVALQPELPSSDEALLTDWPAGDRAASGHDEPIPFACPEFTVPAEAVASAAPGPADRSDSRVAEFTASIHSVVAPAAQSFAKLRFVSGHPPHVPLYLRTARLLI